MLEKYAAQIVGVFASLHRLAEQVQGMRPDHEPTVAELADLWLTAKATIEPAIRLARTLPLRSFSNGIKRIDQSFETIPPVASLVVFRDLLNDLPLRLQEDLDDLHFLYVPARDAETYSNAFAGWGAVPDKFPSAKADIEAASRCIALGIHAAAIYHLMRVFERGFHVLARDRGVHVGGREIGKVISELSPIIAKIAQWPKTVRSKRRAAEFYSGALAEALALKDKWRNPASHLGGPYDEIEAQSALVHTRNFMTGLTLYLSERRRKPLVWK